MSEWIALTSRTERVVIWVNMIDAIMIVPDAGGSKITFQGRDKEVFVSEKPDVVLTRTAAAKEKNDGAER